MAKIIRPPLWIQAVRQTTDQKHTQRRRVVQTATGEKVQVAEKDAFLGFQNQVFDRQTVSRRHLSSMKSPGQTGKTPSEIQKKIKPVILGQLGLPILPRVLPTPHSDTPDWATPGSRAEDYVAGMLESDRTALNTKEFIFYGYFQRIRERLDHAWVPILRAKLTVYYQTGRHLASDMEHTTRVLVVLNEKGEIIRVEMVGESGTKALDDAAIGAFNQAGPFPNPPRGIVDRNHEIRIPWDFVLKT